MYITESSNDRESKEKYQYFPTQPKYMYFSTHDPISEM